MIVRYFVNRPPPDAKTRIRLYICFVYGSEKHWVIYCNCCIYSVILLQWTGNKTSGKNRSQKRHLPAVDASWAAAGGTWASRVTRWRHRKLTSWSLLSVEVKDSRVRVGDATTARPAHSSAPRQNDVELWRHQTVSIYRSMAGALVAKNIDNALWTLSYRGDRRWRILYQKLREFLSA